MEKELIKKINTGKLNENQLEFAKAAIKESGLYKCRVNKPKIEYQLDETAFNEIKKKQLELIRKDLFNIEREKLKYQLKIIENNNVPITRFTTPIEALQYKIKNKPLIIDFDKIDKDVIDKKIVPLKLAKK